MTRHIYLAVEATGLDTNTERVVELVALEAVNGRLTGLQFHALCNPQHPILPDAENGTGYTNLALQDKPLLAERIDAFLAFVRGSHVIAANPAWSVAMLDADLERLGWPPLAKHVRSVQRLQDIAQAQGVPAPLKLAALSERYPFPAPSHPCSETWLQAWTVAHLHAALKREAL